jgi:hypothetical protein
MTAHDDDRPGDDGVHRSTPAGRPRVGRRQAVVGVIGLAAVLGGGSYLLTTHLTSGNNSTATSGAGALGTFGGPTPDSPDVSPAAPSAVVSTDAPDAMSPTPTLASAAVTTRPATAPTVKPAATTNPAAVKKEVQDAREKAEKDGVSLQRPLSAKGGSVQDLSTRTEKTGEGTIRITTAKGDLTGQQDQLMAADGGTPVGQARCTQRLHFSNAGARKIPTILLCWRTSASRSVVTLAVSRNGKPSEDASTAVIDREWARLG